jgi:hypothetical protein
MKRSSSTAALLSAPVSAAAQQFSGPLMDVILTAVEGIRFGSIEIVINDSKVVLITRTEKLRIREEGPI